MTNESNEDKISDAVSGKNELVSVCESLPCWCYGAPVKQITTYTNGKEVKVLEACALNNILLGHANRPIDI